MTALIEDVRKVIIEVRQLGWVVKENVTAVHNVCRHLVV